MQNVSKWIMLSLFLAFLFNACSGLRPIETTDRTRKSPSTQSSSSKSSVSGLRKDITQYAKKQVGTKYKYGGKTPKGFDCSGFTYYVMRNFDVDIAGSSSSQARMGKKISSKKAQPGDLVFFARGSKVFHVAMVYKNTSAGIEVIHSTSSRGVIIENISKSSYWKPKMAYVRDVLD